jgi:hypothetical protein
MARARCCKTGVRVHLFSRLGTLRVSGPAAPASWASMAIQKRSVAGALLRLPVQLDRLDRFVGKHLQDDGPEGGPRISKALIVGIGWMHQQAIVAECAAAVARPGRIGGPAAHPRADRARR